MAPIPRCDLRLPNEPDYRRSSPTIPPADADDQRSVEASVTAPPKRPSLTHGSSKRHSLADAPTKRPSLPNELSKRPSDVGKAPLHAQRSETRDSAEILEGAPEFSTGVTRDMAEVRDHKLHEAGTAAEETAVEEETELDACSVLAQCRAEVEAEAAAAAAAAVIDEEDVFERPLTTVAPSIDTAATPGDVCAHFCEDRPESPSSDYDLQAVVAADKFGRRAKVVKQCKGKYALVEAYPGLWGGQKAWGARKKLELEMRTKRKLYEGLHERNRRRREKERRRCKEKSRMMRCRDQAKITEVVDNITVNKAFYLRFNYNKRLPFMPSAMTEHLRRFKKPPFKFFPKGSRYCRKEVDEFAKLRVTEVAKVGSGLTTSTPTVKTKA